MRRNIKRFAACFAAASAVTFGVLGFASCDISMQQESGYKEGRYAVTSGFSSIDIDADGGVNFTLSYGEAFEVDYSESEQEKFDFSVEDGTLVISQRRSVASLLNYKEKTLNIVVPKENKISSVSADVNGAFTCDLTGDYRTLAFETAGKFTADFTGSAETLTVECIGNVDFKDRAFSANTVSFDCTGALNFEITCNVLLDVECAGSCGGTYYGDCKVEKRIVGADMVVKGN